MTKSKLNREIKAHFLKKCALILFFYLTMNNQSNNISAIDLLKIYKQLPHIKRDLRGNKLEEYLSQFESKPFTQLQKNAIVGTLLGDGTLGVRGTKPHLKIEQGKDGKGGPVEELYVHFLYTILSDYVGSPPQIYYKKGKAHSCWFRTFGLKKLDYYMDQFYAINSMGHRKKVVPKNIHQMLNPEVLSFWFCDDGSKDKSGYKLSTDGFLKSDVIRLQQALATVFGFEVNLRQDFNHQSYYLYIAASSRNEFTRLVEPNMVETMKYKLHPLT